MRLNIFAAFLFLVTTVSFSQENIIYKQVDTIKLYMEVHTPPGMDVEKEYPCIVFFFGGGWVNGNRYHFLEQAKYLSERGMICFLVDYRIASLHGTTPFEALEDAKSAIRFIRENNTKFNIDKGKIIAAGGSAGGHLISEMADG